MKYSPYEVRKKGKTIITAHSGCENTLPNSREHIAEAIKSDAEMIEVDVRRSGSLLYLSHDISENPLECVSLDEFLDTILPYEKIRINFDVKTEELVPFVMEKVNARNMAKMAVFTGACNHKKDEVEGLGAELWISLWPSADNEGDIVRATDFCISKDLSCINLHYSMINEANYNLLKENGLCFSAWTADDESEIKRLLEMKIKNITTRKPCLALKLRKEIQGDIKE